jgi:O-antigen ligase
LKWKKIVILAPIIAVILIFSVPGVYERMTHGIEGDSVETEVNERAFEYEDVIGTLDNSDGINIYAVTSGRSLAWPFVIEKIEKKLWFGYGRMAMINSGTTAFLMEALRESFPHPHSAYLQLVFDNGLVGAVPVFILFLLFLKYSFSLFKEKEIPNYIVAGGMSLSLILAFMVASFGSQTFYPREGSVGMWCSIALMLRMYVNRSVLRQENVQNENGLFEQKPEQA